MRESESNLTMQTGVAGALALAAGSAAYGAIVVVAPPPDLPNVASPATAGAINWDVNGDAVNAFNFTFRNPQAAGTGVQWQANMNTIVPGGNRAVAGYQGPFVRYASRLTAGQSIGAALPAGVTWQNTA